MTFFGWACLYIYIYICAGMTYYIVCVCVCVHFVRLFDKFTTVYAQRVLIPVCVCVCVLYVCLSPWIIVGRVAIGNYVEKKK